MEILHKECEGLIEKFGKDYGLCTYCGKEGYYKIVNKDGDVIFVEFVKITAIRK